MFCYVFIVKYIQNALEWIHKMMLPKNTQNTKQTINASPSQTTISQTTNTDHNQHDNYHLKSQYRS